MPRDQATLTSRVIRVLLYDLSHHNSILDLRDIEIVCQPFLLGMEGELVFPFSDQSSDIFGILPLFSCTGIISGSILA